MKKMKFPITRTELQAHTKDSILNELKEEMIYLHLYRIIRNIKEDFEKNFLIGMKDKRFIIKLDSSFRNKLIVQDPSAYGITTNHVTKLLGFKISIDSIIESLKKNFLGCDILIDPLETYIIIDWS
jgi:hypothetical protein